LFFWKGQLYINHNCLDLSETSGFALRLEEDENISLTDGALNVTDDGTGLIVKELNLNLDDSTAGASSAKKLGNTTVTDNVLLQFSKNQQQLKRQYTSYLDHNYHLNLAKMTSGAKSRRKRR
jgi:hypothetical protein